MFSKATLKERRQYYREEWSTKDMPDFILKDLKKREFGFDHNGKGPNDRYKVFRGRESLKKFLRYKAPFAAYISVAFLSYGAIVFTGSRGGLLFGAVELMILIVYFAVTDKKHRKPLLIIIGVIFAAGICVSPKLVHLMRYTLERFTSYNENFRRLGLIKRSFEDFLSNPLTGRGFPSV